MAKNDSNNIQIDILEELHRWDKVFNEEKTKAQLINIDLVEYKWNGWSTKGVVLTVKKYIVDKNDDEIVRDKVNQVHMSIETLNELKDVLSNIEHV